VHAATDPCQFQSATEPVNVAFCETFDVPAPTGNRSGQLNGTLWGVSRVSGNENFSSPADGWANATLSACGTTQTVHADSDIVVCNGQAHEAVNDGGTVASLAMYPKQPFDFAGRTGVATFDVSDDSAGSHAAWPEFWMSDKPVPDPFAHEASWRSGPQNGFGVRFAGSASGSCPEGAGYVSVDSAIVVRNYVHDDSFSGGSLNVQTLDCVKQPTNGQLNHFELRISQSQIDVYGTDAGTATPLKHIAVIPNANLTLTRGLIWIEDVHYNADKFSNQGNHTFHWDNVGFDGPTLPRDMTFDALDKSATELGWFIGANGHQTVNTLPMTADNISAASAALLTFNFWSESAPFPIQYAVNGHAHTAPWPFADSDAFTPRALSVPVPLTDLVAGTNTVTISTGSYGLNVMNFDLILVGAGGLPGGGGGGGSVTTPGVVQQQSPANGATGQSTTPTLSWIAPSGAVSGTTQYTVSLHTSSGTALANLAATTSLITAVPVGEGLQAGQTYWWNVVACNGTACSSLNPTWDSFTVAASTLVADFSLTISPTSLSVQRTSSGSYLVTLTASGGFSSPVSLSVSGLPAGTTASFRPQTVTPTTAGASSTLTVQAGNRRGSTTLTVSGTGGGLAHSVTATLQISR
jgi:hypothetical protein